MPRIRKLAPDDARALRRQLHAAVAEGGLPIPEAICRMRQALGLTQAAFGKVFGLTTRQVWELEAGIANPTAATLERIGTPFGFAPGFVMKPDRGRI
jgi:DNA-binding transcriptional regulator YiaG